MCPAATWNTQFGRDRGRSSEVACWGADTSGGKVKLSEQFRLDSGKSVSKYPYDCFSSGTSRIREHDEVMAIPHDDFFLPYATQVPPLALASVLVGYTITLCLLVVCGSLRQQTYDSVEEDLHQFYSYCWKTSCIRGSEANCRYSLSDLRDH